MLSKNEFRQFKTELDFIIKEHDPSTIKIIGRLAALDSPKEQLEEIRKKFDYMVSKLFDKYGLEDTEMFDNFDEFWERICDEELDSDITMALKTIFLNQFEIPSNMQTVLSEYYDEVESYCIDYAKKQIKHN